MGDEGLGNGITDGDARVQAGIRVLEDDLQLTAIAIHVALPQTGELHVVVIHLPAAGFEQTQDEPPSDRLATPAPPPRRAVPAAPGRPAQWSSCPRRSPPPARASPPA